MSIPHSVSALIERFDRNKADYKSGGYNEAQVRKEFIDPFFEALGWDVNNTKGYAEAYKDVIHEDSIKIGKNPEAPDYCFRIGGTRKFFLEAKKPSIDVKNDPHPAYQLRRYAWSSKLPLSILTDFEEFAIYDCRVKPVNGDKSTTARLNYYTYDTYPDKWDEIASIFSHEAVLKGSFDRYAKTSKGKRGSAEVDTAFLKEIESWREMLAKNIALRNSALTRRQLNYCVQRTIDRIIFLRICEDRSIEKYQTLMALQNGKNVYPRLCDRFNEADHKYNSGLFHFTHEKGEAEDPDELSLSLIIDDKPLKDIIKRLYYPESPYEFSVLPADILGQVYEQFLGKVIRLTDGHQAKVEDKPEVKKAGGVFYTPTCIVDYIVKHTVGKLLEGKTPKQAEKLRILDPACGSGSFLIGAYQKLLDWHLDRYSENPEKWLKKRKPPLVQLSDKDYRLTTEERKRILLNNIYGVDIDSQAVEVTKLSLLLKILEGESQQSLDTQFKLLHKRILPDLASNIKCGNSLIASDFYIGKPLGDLFDDEEERYRINVFDWEKEFPAIFEADGFDAVIGNPPYVRQEMLSEFKQYFQQKYNVYQGAADLYVYFFEKGASLLKKGGMFSYIVANKWMRANYGKPLRQWLNGFDIKEIIDFGDLPVFQKATTYPCIFILNNKKATSTLQVVQVNTLDFTDLSDYVDEHKYNIDRSLMDDETWNLSNDQHKHLINKIRTKGVPLGEYVQNNIYRGVLTGLNDAFVIDEDTKNRLIKEDPKSAEIIKPFLAGRDIKRYQTLQTNKYLIFIPNGWTNKNATGDAWIWLKRNFAAIASHLATFKDKAEKRWDKGEYWWELRTCEYYNEFEKPKILVPAITKKASYTYDTFSLFSNDKTTIIPTDDLFLLGIMNSILLDYILFSISSSKRGGYYEYKPMYISQLPIRTIDFDAPADVDRHDRMVELVTAMLDLHKQLAAARTGDDKTAIQRIIDATDTEIDRLVYDLYELTDEEIRIVEGQDA